MNSTCQVLCVDPLSTEKLEIFRVRVTNLGHDTCAVGVALEAHCGSFSANKDNWSYGMTGEKHVLGVSSSYGDPFSDGDLIEVHVQIAQRSIEFIKNGQSQGKLTGQEKLFGKPVFFGVSYRYDYESWEIQPNDLD